MTLSVDIHEEADLTTPVASPASTFEKAVNPVINDAGTGSFSILLDDADIAEVQFGRVAMVNDPVSAQRFGFVVESQRRKVLDVGGKSQHVNAVAGRLLPALLERAVVFPEGGANRSQFQDTRVFNWANPSFDDSGWSTPPGFIVQGNNPNSTSQYAEPYQPELLPREWTAPSAEWVLGGTYQDAPDGFWYFRWTFTIATAGDHILDFAIDNDARVYLDGVEIFSGGAAYKDTYSLAVTLPVGNHVVAARLVNFPKVGNNPTAFLGALFEVDDGERGDVVHQTTSASDIAVLITPTSSGTHGTRFNITAPGMTVGEVIDLLLDEAQARGALTGWTWDFTAALDSAGTSWSTVPEISVKVGDDYLTVLRQLAQAYIDFAVDFDAKVLHVYIKGDLGGASGVSFTAGTSVSDLEVEGEG